ncbi:MAG: hypothetical protein RL186_1010, partial [Pseudomonadota bacterium]
MNLNNMMISKKLPLVIVALSALAVAISGGAAYFQSAHTLDKSSEHLLVAEAKARGDAITQMLAGVEAQTKELAASPHVGAALDQFAGAYAQLGPDAEKVLQGLYIDQNPNAFGQKERLDAANSGSDYDVLHARLHPWFRSILRLNDYYDIFLFDANGRNVYTVFKERDFATNLVSGQWKDSNLGALVTGVLNGPADAGPKLADFAPYAPSNDVPAGFVAVPIKGSDGKIKGVLAVQLSIAKFDQAMAQMPANGATGENTLVGADGLARNNSPLEKDATILKRKVESPELAKAKAGQSGFAIGQNAAGQKAYIAFQPIEIMGTTYAILSDITEQEVHGPLRSLALNILLLTLAVSAGAGAIGYVFARGLSRPIDGLTLAMRNLAAGDTNVTIPSAERGDELGTMAQAVEVFRANAIERIKLESAAAADNLVQMQRAETISS